MAIQNATAVTLSVAGEVMAHATSASLSVSMDLRDSTTKSSAGWSESLGGLKSWEMSGDAFVDIAATNASMADCFDALIAGAAVAAVFTIDSETYTGTALITSVSADAGVEENTTFSVSLTGTAALVRA
jgi:predicted secreted protein